MVDEGKGREKIDRVREIGEEKREGAVDAWCSVYGRQQREAFKKWHKSRR